MCIVCRSSIIAMGLLKIRLCLAKTVLCVHIYFFACERNLNKKEKSYDFVHASFRRNDYFIFDPTCFFISTNYKIFSNSSTCFFLSFWIDNLFHNPPSIFTVKFATSVFQKTKFLTAERKSLKL